MISHYVPLGQELTPRGSFVRPACTLPREAHSIFGDHGVLAFTRLSQKVSWNRHGKKRIDRSFYIYI